MLDKELKLLYLELIRAASWHLRQRDFTGSTTDDRWLRMAIKLKTASNAVNAQRKENGDECE